LDLYLAQGEVTYIAQKHVLVADFLAHHPGFFAKLTLRRAINYWTGFWSLDPSYMQQEPTQLPNVFFCTSLTLLMLLGACDWWRRDRMAAIAYLLPIVIFPIAYYISHPLMDYRQPIEPQIVILVVVGLGAVKRSLKARSLAKGPAAVRQVLFAGTGEPDLIPALSYAELAVDLPSTEVSAVPDCASAAL
jgi:hypothetical protein